MMFSDPLGAVEAFSFALVRTSLRGKPVSLTALAYAKLNPERPTNDAPSGGILWPSTAAGFRMALAPGVEDIWQDPMFLFGRYEAELARGRTEGLVVTTLRFSAQESRHDMLNIAHAFALKRFARARRLSTMVVLHVPGDAGSSNPPHAHLISVVRRHDRCGFSSYDAAIFQDDAQLTVLGEWLEFQKDWGEQLPV